MKTVSMMADEMLAADRARRRETNPLSAARYAMKLAVLTLQYEAAR